jgi:hypothetical protein
MPFFFDPAFDAVLQPIPGVKRRMIADARGDRWDGLDLTAVEGTYGDYLLGKVAKVFPDLGACLTHGRRCGPAANQANMSHTGS